MSRKRYWLLKSEPDEFSIHDLAAMPNQTSRWDGVRNYQARNFLRDDMAVGDGVFFYHSNAKPPGVVGTAKVVRAGYPDPTALDSKHKNFDPKHSADKPLWFLVDVQLDRIFARMVPLEVLRVTPGLESMVATQKGSRLSVQPVTPAEWKIVVALGA